MRAGRLLEVLLLLEARGRMSAPALARELEVSVRTVMRDLEDLAGAGVPVVAIRGRDGGYELLGGYRSGLSSLPAPPGERRRGGPSRRARVRISPEGRRVAVVLGRLPPLRVRRNVADDDGWVEASFLLDPAQAVARELLALGPEVEVLAPAALRDEVATLAVATAARYRPS